MDKVLYVIGAGFSAPLGVPTMRNFLFRSKDLYFSNPEKYQHFQKVFETITNLSKIKNYYDADLFNIEEILSIIEMNQFLDGGPLHADFINYIKDVIRSYTPQSEIEDFPGNWEDFLFGKDKTLSLYGYFVATLMGMKFSRKNSDRFTTLRQYDFFAEKETELQTKYSVLSLNYDLVLENVAESINKQYIAKFDLQFNKTSYDPEWDTVHLAKLHGCLDSEEIVPPTWAKGTHKSIVPIWRNAFEALESANHIRFVGYSLPLADSYIKYLLKASVIDSPHLKSIDVICLDGDESVRSRYNDFFKFSGFRFANASVVDYLTALKRSIDSRSRNQKGVVSTIFLEEVHEDFFKNCNYNK